MEKFYILKGISEEDKISLYIKEVEFGKIALINWLGAKENIPRCELLLTDEEGENVYSGIDEFPFTIALPKNFNFIGKVLIDVFSSGKAIVSDVLNAESNNYNSKKNFTNIEQIFDEEYNELLKEADYFIKKAQKMYSAIKEDPTTYDDYLQEDVILENNKPTFFDYIKDDFELLFGEGEEDYLLSKLFTGAKWRKINFDGEAYTLGKFYKEDGTTLEGVAIAVPAVNDKIKSAGRDLGVYAKFYKATIYDDFGFWVLVQSAINGKALKV